ncbi:hypothetical protein KUV56_02440 [Ferrimonas balearica]|uniref:hypothetical protein n=1 Tax=Ferrimonas balearica TaxID=44012 RepID=UPI001C59F0F3|nr:hypothetical protein [Ferrimonas balearica]MBW3138384.1 hypothetical protein [Ferrimonas balearica]MBY6105447.1 hypothetical protein [Ferrimonas balearica]
MFVDADITSLDECILRTWTYYSMDQCIALDLGESESAVRYLKRKFPGLLIGVDRRTVSAEKLDAYRAAYGIVVDSRENPLYQELHADTQDIPPVEPIPAKEVENTPTYTIVAPDWYVEDDEYQQYHLYVNGRNGVISEVKLRDGVATFRGDIPLNDYVQNLSLSDSEIHSIFSHLTQGIDIGKTIALDSGARFGLSVDDPSLSLSIIKDDQEEVYSYGLKRGIIHWQNLSVYFDDISSDVSANLRAKDSYKGQFGMFSMDYYGETNSDDSYIKLQDASFMLKPFRNGMQMGIGWLTDESYNEPYGTLGYANLLKTHRFAGLELFNFSSFDHEFKVNQSGEGFDVFSRGYAYASIYANGRFVTAINLEPGFNRIDDRLLDDGQNLVEVKKRYNDGTEDSETINYFKKSLARADEQSLYLKLALGAKEIEGEYQGAVTLKSALNSHYGDIDFQTSYFAELGDISSEIEYQKSFGPFTFQLYGAAATNGESGYGTRISATPFSRIYSSIEYRSVDSKDCSEQSRFLSYNCFDDLNAYVSLQLPYGVFATYNYKYVDYDTSGVKTQTNRMSLNKYHHFSNGITLGLNGSFEQHDDMSGFMSGMDSENLYVGFNLSYNQGQHSTSYDASYNDDLSGETSYATQDHSLGYSTRLDDLSLNARAGVTRSELATSHYASVSARYGSDFGAFYGSGSFSQFRNQFSLAHDYLLAVNDRSYSFRSHQTAYTDTGVIFDTASIPSDELLTVMLKSKNSVISYRLDGSEQKFFPLEPGRYTLSVKSTSVNRSRLSDILINEKLVDIFKGDVRTIDFTYSDKFVIAFNDVESDKNRLLNIKGCDRNFGSDGEYEFTCTSKDVFGDGMFEATFNDNALLCRYDDMRIYSDMYYSLGSVRCE